MYSLDLSLTITSYVYSFVKHTITPLFTNLSNDICFVSCIHKYVAYEKNNVRPLVKQRKDTKGFEVQNWFRSPSHFLQLMNVVFIKIYTYFSKLTQPFVLEYK